MPRLYLQQGLSNRVINAVSQRLERVLSMATGAGDRMAGVVEETLTVLQEQNMQAVLQEQNM